MIRPECDGRLIINGKPFPVNRSVFSAYSDLEFPMRGSIEVAIEETLVDDETIRIFVDACQCQPVDWDTVNTNGILELARVFNARSIEEAVYTHIGTGEGLFLQLNECLLKGYDISNIVDQISGLHPSVLEERRLREKMIQLPTNIVQLILSCLLCCNEVPFRQFLEFILEYANSHGEEAFILLSLMSPDSLSDDDITLLLNLHIPCDFVNGSAFMSSLLDVISRNRELLAEQKDEIESIKEDLSMMRSKCSDLERQLSQSRSDFQRLAKHVNVGVLVSNAFMNVAATAVALDIPMKQIEHIQTLIRAQSAATVEVETLERVSMCMKTRIHPTNPHSGHENTAIVIDAGSSTCKAGFAGYEAPFCDFPSIIGRLRVLGHPTPSVKETYVGDELAKKSTWLLHHMYPIVDGVINNWDDMERIYERIFYKLSVDPPDHPVLLSEVVMNTKGNREKMAEIMLEKFQVPSICIASQEVLSLFSSCRTTGIVVHSGDGVSHIAPIYEGYHDSSATAQFNLSGSDLTAWLAKLLSESGSQNIENTTIRDIKEKVCCVRTYGHSTDMGTREYTSYALPDCRIIHICDERFRCPELLFEPRMNGFEFDGIHKTLFSCIERCDSCLRKDLCANILLAGGNTMFKGLADRIEKEITALAPTMQINVTAPECKYSAWLGGSILASLPTFPQMIVTQDEYHDAGGSVVHRKCLNICNA